MFFIPGILISIATFPGIIVHELAHQLACWLMKVPVYEVRYFRFKRPNGYVVHERTKNYRQTVVISMGPFVVNSIVGCAIFSFGYMSAVFGFSELLLLWLGVSIMMHAFPSKVDLDYVFAELKTKQMPFISKIVVFPIALLMLIGTFGSIVWLDLLYAVGLGALVNTLIIAAL